MTRKPFVHPFCCLALVSLTVASAGAGTQRHVTAQTARVPSAIHVAPPAAPTDNTGHTPDPERAEAADAAASAAGWQAIVLPNGLTVTQTHNLAVHPGNAYEAYLATGNGLFKTTNAGDTWQQIGGAALNGYVAEVVIAQSNPSRMYARSWELYRSNDSGQTWQAIAKPPSACGLHAAPSNAEVLYARKCGDGASVHRSSDGGNSWSSPTTFTESFDALAIAPNDPNALVAAGFNTVFRSADGGANWVKSHPFTVYFGRPIFAPTPPHTLYLGHWTGLLRSNTRGQTWEDGALQREFSTLAFSSGDAGSLVGGSDDAAWQVSLTDKGWRTVGLSVPSKLQWLGGSTGDGRVLYARNGAGLWRRLSTPDIVRPYRINVPLAMLQGASSFPGDPSSPAAIAINRANVYRAKVGAAPLLAHDAIIKATQAHANYHRLNANDSSAWEFGAHGEVQGKPGFTGKWPGDRMKAQGYPWFGGSEVMHFIGDPVASVDDWMATIYHRIITLDPGAVYAGYGNVSEGARVDVMDFGGGPTSTGLWSSAQPYPLAYPANGQSEVPAAWGGGEYPDPLPPGAARPVGYPFTLQGVRGELTVSFIEMRGPGGTLVPVHPNPPDCKAFGCVALIPVAPLLPGTTYTINARGSVSDVAFDQRWSFTTALSSAL